MAKGPTISTTFNAIDRVSRPMQRMAKNVSRIATVAGAAVSTGLGAGLAFAVREASKIEDAVAGFTPLLGSVGKANELVDQLNKTAATTPFQFENIAAAAKQLLPVMNQDIARTTETFRMLGDTAGGNAQKLESITRGFTKAMLKGKVDMESLNMIAEAGVPIYSELANSLGVSVEEMMKMSSAGKIASSDLEDAFKNMTSEGGIFFNGMAIASQTFTGKMSTLKDNIALTAAAVGSTLLPMLKDYVDMATQAAAGIKSWVEANKEMIGQKIEETLDGIIRAATILWKLWDSGIIPAVLAVIAVFQILYPIIVSVVGIIKIWKTAQLSLNAVLMANPIGLIVVGIAALVAVVVLLWKNWDKVTAVLQKVWDFMKAMAAWIADKFLGVIDKVVSGAQVIGGALKGFGDSISGGGRGRGTPLVGRNDAQMAGAGAMNSSQLSVNFNNAPAGTTFRQTGSAPGITVDTGRRGRL
jgi:tape measure domain-containing protein